MHSFRYLVDSDVEVEGLRRQVRALYSLACEGQVGWSVLRERISALQRCEFAGHMEERYVNVW